MKPIIQDRIEKNFPRTTPPQPQQDGQEEHSQKGKINPVITAHIHKSPWPDPDKIWRSLPVLLFYNSMISLFAEQQEAIQTKKRQKWTY